MTREAEARLDEMHRLALQRLLSFEASGGGFAWYGGQAANTVLTAYGTMFLADLAKVHEYDPRILSRAMDWLEAHQDREGRWVGSDAHATWSRLSDAAIPSTAYVAWALRRAHREDTRAVGRAEEFLRKADVEDAYALALIGNAFPTKQNLERLSKLSQGGRWTTMLRSWNHAGGRTADIETTALAVLALARHNPELADLGATWLIQQKDFSGTWGSTHATVLALQALAAAGGGAKGKAGARIWVNGIEIPDAFVESDQAQSVDLSSRLHTGPNEVTLETQRRVNAQIAGRYYVPWGTEDLLRGVEGLNLQVSYDRLSAKVGEVVTCTVKVEADAFMVLAEVAIPPGFTVDTSALEELVRKKIVDKYSQSGRTLTFYLPGKSATFSYALKPRYPVKVSVPRSIVYEYYSPDRRVIAPPLDLVVTD